MYSHNDLRLFLNWSLSPNCDHHHLPIIADNCPICHSNWFTPWTGTIRHTRWVTDLREIMWGLLDHHLFNYPYPDPGPMVTEKELYWTLGLETNILYFQSIRHMSTFVFFGFYNRNWIL